MTYIAYKDLLKLAMTRAYGSSSVAYELGASRREADYTRRRVVINTFNTVGFPLDLTKETHQYVLNTIMRCAWYVTEKDCSLEKACDLVTLRRPRKKPRPKLTHSRNPLNLNV